MFSLLFGFWKIFFRKAEFHILILGVDHAGKTTVLEQMKALYLGLESLPPGRIPPTVGLNIGRMLVSGAKLILWDVGGQRGLRSLWEKYYAEAHALLYVIDSTDRERFEESRQVLQGLLAHPDLEGIPLLVLANKQDAEGAISPLEIEAEFELQQSLSSAQQRRVLGVSAIDGSGLREGISWLIETVRQSPRALGMQGI